MESSFSSFSTVPMIFSTLDLGRSVEARDRNFSRSSSRVNGFCGEPLCRFTCRWYSFPSFVLMLTLALWKRSPLPVYPPALTAVDFRSAEVAQCYVYPHGTTTLANQFIPRPGAESGWVGVYLVSPRRDVQYWLFDAERIAAGPIARLGHPDLRPARTIHHTWTATAPQRTAAYHVSIADDLGDDWRHLPEPFRQVVETGLRCAERPH